MTTIMYTQTILAARGADGDHGFRLQWVEVEAGTRGPDGVMKDYPRFVFTASCLVKGQAYTGTDEDCHAATNKMLQAASMSGRR